MTEKTSKKHRRFRLLLGVPIALLATLLGMLVLAYAVLQSPIGKGRIASELSTRLSEAMGQDVVVRGISGDFPFNMHIEEITVADEEGQWLLVEDITVRISRSGLLQRFVRLGRLHADHVVLSRLPASPPDPEPEPFSVPEIPRLPRWFSLQEIGVDEMVLGEPLFGEEATFTMDGHLLPADETRAWDLAVKAVRVDKPTTEAEIRAGVTDNMLDLRLVFIDSGLLAQRLGTNETVSLMLTGDGPPEDWAGALEAAVGEDKLIASDVHLALAEEVSVDLDGNIALAHDLLPKTLAGQLGESADFEISARLRAPGVIVLEPLALEAPKGSASVRGEVAIEDLRLDLAVEAAHENLQVFSLSDEDAEAAPPPPLPASLEATLKGPLESFQLAATADLNGADALALDVKLGIDEDLTASGTAQVLQMPPPLPELVTASLEMPLDAAFDLRYTPEGTLSITSSRLESGGNVVKAAGVLNLEQNLIDLQYQANLANPGMAVPEEQQLALGAADLAGAIKGDADATTVSAEMNVQNLQREQVTVGSITADLSARLGGFPDDLMQQASLAAQGQLGGLQIAEQPPRDASFAVEAAMPEPGRIAIETLQVQDQNITLAAQGVVDTEAPAADLEGTLQVKDLNELAQLAGQDFGGALEAELDMSSPEAGVISMQIAANWQEPSGLPDPLPAVLGDAVQATADLRLADDILTVQSLAIDAANAEAEAAGTYALESQEMDLEADVQVADLSAAATPEAPELSGSAVANVKVTGALPNLTINATAEAEDLVTAQVRAEEATLTAQVQNVPEAPRGSVELEAVAEGEPVALAAEFQLEEQTLILPELRLSSNENNLNGNFRYDLEEKTGSGEIEADLNNLARLGSLLNQDWAGQAQADLSIAAEDGAMTVEGEAAGDDIVLAGLTAESFSLTADLSGLPESPQGTFQLTAKQLVQGELVLDSVEVAGEGAADAMELSAETSGNLEAVAPFDAQAAATVNLDDKSLLLRRLDGTLDQHTFSLADPSTLSWQEDNLRIEQTRLQFDDGYLVLDGGLQADTVDFSATWEDLPLAAAMLFGAPAIEGSARGSLTLQGPAADPTADLELGLQNVQSELAPPEAPPAAITASAQLAGGAMRLAATLDVPDAAGVQLELRAPAEFSVDPFAFNMPQQGDLNGSLDGEANLAAIPQLMGIEDHLVQGDFAADMAIRGTVQDPLLTGEARITGGRYENVATGTILESLEATLESRGREIVLTRLEATDGEGGRITGEGELQLDPEASFPFRIDVDVQDAQLVRRDDFSGEANGEVGVAGDMSDMEVTGDLTVGPAEVAIPERAPAEELTAIDWRTLEQAEGSTAEQPGEEIETGEEGGTRVALNVQTRYPGQVFVTATGLESEWEGNLHVTGTADDPRIEGRLTVVRGYFEFLGRRFQLDDSTLTFDADSPPSPYLNVVAVYDARDIVARLILTGSFSDLQVRMESEPPLPQDEILARVLFGKDMSDISPVQALQLARYAGMLSGGMKGTRLFGGMPDLPGIDQLDLRAGPEGGTAIGVGKYVTEDVYVELEQGIGGESSRARVEVEITDELSLEGEASADQDSSIGLFWKKDY